MNTFSQLKHQFTIYLTKLTSDVPHFDFILNTDEQKQQFGDISSNCALILAKKVGKNPRELAQHIVSEFSDTAFSKIEIAGPGFLNFFFTQETLQIIAQELFVEKDHYFELEKHAAIYNVEFVSANPTGPLHLGHGRGGIIGDVLSNILSFVGHKTTKEHYINDAGAQIDKLGNSLFIRCRQATGESIELSEDAYHGEYLQDLAQQCIQEHGKNVVEKPLEFFKEYGYKHQLAVLKNTLKNYGIIFDIWFSERTLHTKGIEKALNILKQSNKTYDKDGALWFKSTEYGDDKDRVLKKADGSYTYAAADAAYLMNKADRGFNKLILVLGQDHHSYPQRLDGMRQALGLTDVSLNCILYQLVSMNKAGQAMRMSKRAGAIVSLQDIIDTVGSDVARFFYLNRKADAHLEFDLELALKEGDENPVYYLQYAYVRTLAILRKSEEFTELTDITKDDVQGLTDTEALLIKKMASLYELLEAITHNYQVHLLTYYLLELAHLFHAYYAHNRVIDPQAIKQSRGRLLIVMLVKDTFERCLKLMGISQPQSM